MIYILFLLLETKYISGCGGYGYVVQYNFKNLKSCQRALVDAKKESLFKDGYCQEVKK
jgi:hypothetical protein